MSDNRRQEGSIGVFDSGVGGISVLRELVRELPEENFWFFGDSAHAPYGEKSTEEIRRLAVGIADRMIAGGVKAVVIACNTATSAAVRTIREIYGNQIPVIGIEPALKPAARMEHHGKILVMATPATLKLDKYHTLSGSLAGEAEFLPVACEGLAARIEKGNLDAADLKELLRSLIGDYAGKVDGVVLGCTHYPFIRRQIAEIVGDVPMFDGGAGTARELRRQLEKRGLRKQAAAVRSCPSMRREDPVDLSLRDGTYDISSHIYFESSINTEEELQLYRDFFSMQM